MGKRTTTRHKEDNTFKFETFEEKLRNISVNVNLSIRDGRTNVTDDQETYFFQEIEKWIDLNRTESFGHLLSELGQDVKTLPQLLLYKEKLAQILLKQLENRDNLPSYEPTFALIVALSRDLGPEFYTYFPKFFKEIIDIVITIRKPEIIEQGFKCYAYLSKYLRRQIVRDLPQNLKLFAPLLNPKLKTYVVIFASESFEVVVSKYARENSEKFLDLVFKILLQNKKDNATGVATLLFAMFKGVNKSLKINGPGFMLMSCINFVFKLEQDQRSLWIQVIKILLGKMMQHANELKTKELFEIFENLLLDPKHRYQAPTILLFYQVLVEFDNCSKVPDLGRCVNTLKIITASILSDEDVLKNFSDLVVALIEHKGKSSNPEILTSLKITIVRLFEHGDAECVQKVDSALQDTTHYFHSYLSTIVKAYERVEVSDNSAENKAIRCISEAVMRQEGFYHNLKKDTHLFSGFAGPMWFYENQKKLIRPLNLNGLLSKSEFHCCTEFQKALESLSTSADMENLTRLFLSYSRISVAECQNCVEKSKEIANLVISHHQMCEDLHKPTFSMLFQFIMETLVMHGPMEAAGLESLSGIKIQDFLNSIRNVVVGAASAEAPFCVWSLKCLDLLTHYAKISGESSTKLQIVEFLNELDQELVSNLQSGFKIVRTLTLSILRNMLELQESSDAKLIEMYERFISIEDMSTLDPKFSPLVKSILTEAKVLMESQNATPEIRKICLKYTLGLMYTNFNLIWPTCVEVIKLGGQNIKFLEFWSIFEPQFQRNFPESSVGSPRSIVFDNEDLNKSDFLIRINEQSFGFPKKMAGNMSLQETLDISQYRINLWKSMAGLPFHKTEFQSIKYIIDKTITNSFEGAASTGREINRTLVPMFEFLEKCELTNVDNQLWERSLDHLISTPDVQKAVWEFLHAKRKKKLQGFKPDIDELIKSDTMDCYHKYRIDAIDTTNNQQYQNETLEKRRLLMDIVLRILIGKERKWKAEKRLQTLRFIGGCSAEDAKKYLELTVGSGLKDLRTSPKALEVKINKIANCIRAWRYKFPTIMDQLINLVCDLASAINNLKKPVPKQDEEELPQEVFEDQKKGALKAARLAIVAFFTFLPKFNLDEATVERIFDVFIWTGIEEMKVHTGSNSSWIMKLFHVWSLHERFHILFAKYKGKESSSPMQALFDLLAFPTVQFDVQKYLIDILLNLTMAPEDEEKTDQDSFSLEHSDKFDAKPITCGGIRIFQNKETYGLNVLLQGKHIILKLFEDVGLFKKFVTQPGGDRCLALVSKLAEFVDEKDEADSIEKLCSIIIETFPIYKYQEENLFNCLEACKNLLDKVPKPEKLLLKLAPSFLWVTGRRLRTALCNILSCQKDRFVFETIRDLNAWGENSMDTPDFSLRQDAFQKLESAIVGDPFDEILFTLASANCFYNMLHEADLGMKNASKNLMIVTSEALKSKSKGNDEQQVKKFLDFVILPRLRGGIHHKDDGKFADFLQVFLAFIQNGQELHGTFKELNKLLSTEIIEGLYDIQIHLRTRAMNKLGIKITELGRIISPNVLKNFVMPLANHNLLDEDKLTENRSDLIHSSIETLKAILKLMPHDQYFKYMTQLVNTPKKNTKLAKQYERILVAVMDAYHFDLSLATSIDGFMKKTEEVKENIEKAQEETVEKEGESDDEEEEMEVDSEEQILTNSEITLLPKAAATKCLRLLKNIIVPKLRKYLNFEEKATHKLSRAEKKVDDDVILKIPCTLALVKLFKKLPKAEGETSIKSIIPCLCAGLRNELFSTRHSIRKTILSVIQELGISQFRSVISYLKATLQRGYQKHVLNYTIGYFMKCLESDLRTHPEYLPIKEILPLCEEELYGVMQEEKDVAAIKAKTKEANKNNAHPILKLCAKCIHNKEHLSSLVDPAITHLTAKRNPKVIKTTRQWLHSISEGLSENVVINHLELIEWLKQLREKESLEEINKINNNETQAKEKKKSKLLVESKDALLIHTLAKKKHVADGKITGQFLLTEFAFSCLYNGLNKSTRLKEALFLCNSIEVLDPFVKPLGEGIQSGSKQVNIVSLRCLTLLFEFDLPSFKNEELVDSLRRGGFIAMNNHCYRTSSDTEMSNATFKFLSAFFTRFTDYKIVVQDFELMLKCIQSYLTHEECSSSAITLLKGVLRNKFKSTNLQELMEDVFKQGIQSLYQHINEGCREAYLTYLNNYCTNPKELTSQVRLILNQFDYQIENGRFTAVEIMNSLLASMPQKSLEDVKELVFLKTLTCIDKETQGPVRSKLGDVIKTLFKNDETKSLVKMFLKLMNSDNHISELDTFFLVAGVLIPDSKILVGQDLIDLLNKIEVVLNPEKYSELCLSVPNISVQAQDYSVFQALMCLKKGLDRKINGQNLWKRKSQNSSTMESIFHHIQTTHLLYEHVWVPPVALDILFHTFSQLHLSGDDSKDNIAQLLEEEQPGDDVVLRNVQDLSVLAKNIWTILKFSEDDIVMKGTFILIQLTCIAARFEELDTFEEIIGEIRKSVNHEVVRDPKNTKIRSLAFALFRGIANNSPIQAIKKISEGLTRVAVRELTDEGISAEVKLEAEKLTTILRTILGNAEFNSLYATINDFYHKKRNINRAKKKETFVLHPGKVRKRPKKPEDSKIPFKTAKKRKNK